MREFKFRTPKFEYSSHDFICFYYSTFKGYLNSTTMPGLMSNNFYFGDDQQYIGTHDKKGTPIFEGDIVEVDADYNGDNYYEKARGVVAYSEDEAKFYIHNIKDKYGMIGQEYNWKDSVTVIGNIHEHPWLLKTEEVYVPMEFDSTKVQKMNVLGDKK